MTCHTFYSVFLVWTLPITNSTQWISGIADHCVTVDKQLQEINISITDIYSFVHQFKSEVLKLKNKIKKKHLFLELKLPVDSSYLCLQRKQTCWLQISWSEMDTELLHQPKLDGRSPGTGPLGSHSWKGKKKNVKPLTAVAKFSFSMSNILLMSIMRE